MQGCSYPLAAEQKARLTYDNILRLCDDPDVKDVIRFLREREVVHFQRFGEVISQCKEKMDQKNIYFYNPAFDTGFTPEVQPPVTPKPEPEPQPEPELDLDVDVDVDVNVPEEDVNVEVRISETIRGRGYNPPIYG